MTSEDAITRLGKLDSCAVSEALDRLGLKGAVLGIGPLWPCGRVVGRCVTVKIKPAGLQKPKQHLCTSAIAAAAPTDVIVVTTAAASKSPPGAASCRSPRKSRGSPA